MMFASTRTLSTQLMNGVASTALLLALAAHATQAEAQNSQLEPTFGTHSEGDGFGSFSLTIQAGGAIDASTLADTCNGFIAEAPDIIFDYSGDGSVYFEAFSNADTTMVVEAPDGQILCNDDFNELNAGMQTAAGEPGRYAIWVGTFDPITNNTFPDADLVVTQATDFVDPLSDDFLTGFNAELEPAYATIAVTEGFGTQTFDLQAGGNVNAFATNDACAGFVAQVPDYVVSVAQGVGTLAMAASSQVDTTLVVVGPDGTIHCNDDANEVNPALSFEAPAAGDYAVWVGTFNPPENENYPPAQLQVSSEAGAINAPDAFDRNLNMGGVTPGVLDLTAEPTFGSIDLPDLSKPHEIGLQAGGIVSASTLNPGCAGLIADVPDHVINLTADGQPMAISVTSQVDTTLLVIGPDERVYCNDDDDGLNPGLTIDNPMSGAYSIFVGTYGPGDDNFFPDALLYVAAGDPTPAPASLVDRAVIEPTFGRSTLAAGFGSASAELLGGGDLDAAAMDATCNGFIARAPDHVIDYDGLAGLTLIARSQADTTLAVVDPSGSVHCNDDFEGLSAGLELAGDMPGPYAVWVGTFEAVSDGAFPQTVLAIEEALAQKVPPSMSVSSLNLTAGFTPDPFTTQLAAGGPVEAFTLGSGCTGFIAQEPDFILNYTAGDWPLGFSATADQDLTLTIRTPDGSILCNDDSQDFNPAIAIATPASGTYEVYVGTFDNADINAVASFAITELVDQKVLPEGALMHTTITAGTRAQDFALLAGGAFDASSRFGDQCLGLIATNPDFITTVDHPGLEVELAVRSEQDTTLVVRAPNGDILCDDDSGGDLNPLLLLQNAQEGDYEIWLGTFSGSEHAPATLTVGDASTPAPSNPGGGKG